MQPNLYVIGNSLQFLQLSVCAHVLQVWSDLSRDVLSIVLSDLSCVLFCQIWRPVCNHFDGMVKDFNFGTLLRYCGHDTERMYLYTLAQ